jgi:hypothetical protein
MLTADSTYALGDRRRPQDIVLLSPILARWGLELRFDEDQPAGEHDAARESAGAALPVNLPGQFASRPGGHDARCAIVREGLVARCRIGRGRALIVADAALFEPSDADGKRAAALDRCWKTRSRAEPATPRENTGKAEGLRCGVARVPHFRAFPDGNKPSTTCNIAMKRVEKVLGIQVLDVISRIFPFPPVMSPVNDGPSG